MGRSERTVVVAVWILLTSILVLLVPYHEPWFDEAQAWLIARDSSLIDLFLHRMSYEGTPGLWHLLLWVLNHLHMPYVAMNYFSVAVASLFGAIVLARAPFPLWMRTMLVFGYFPAYQYSIVARSYVLDLLFVAVSAALFEKRSEVPIAYCITLAALANSNAQGFIIGCMLFAEWFWCCVLYRRTLTARHFVASLLFSALAVSAALQAKPAPDVSFWAHLERLPKLVFFRFLGELAPGFVELGRNLVGVVLGTLVSAGLLLITIYVAKKASHGILAVVMFGALMGFGAFEYFMPWHAGTIFAVWLFTLWISWKAVQKLSDEDKLVIKVAVALVLGVQLYDSVNAWHLDYKQPYSASRLGAQRLHEYLAQNPRTQVACIGFKTIALQPYFGSNVCANYYNGQPRPSYYDWKKGQIFPPDAKPAYLESVMAVRKFDVVVVSDMTIPPAVSDNIARESNYCVLNRIPGDMIWKARLFEPDDLLIYQRCKD